MPPAAPSNGAARPDTQSPAPAPASSQPAARQPPDKCAPSVACTPTDARPGPRRRHDLHAALTRAWTRYVPRRGRLLVAGSAAAAVLLAIFVAPVYYAGYARGGTVVATSNSAWDVGYKFKDHFATPNSLLVAVHPDPATMTLLSTAFRAPHREPPPATPREAFDAYILAVTYIPRYESAAAGSAPATVALGLALFGFGQFNNGSRLAACCGYQGMALQFNGADLPLLFNRSMPWVSTEETMLVPLNRRSTINYYPFDAYIAQAAVDMAFTLNNTGIPDPFSETHVPWGVVALTPPTSMDVRVDVVLQSQVPVPFITLRFELRRTSFTKILAVFVCILMWALALCVFIVAIDTLWLRPRPDPSLANMAAAFGLLFALTPLRNIQVGVPPPVVAIDFWGFFAAMALASISALLQCTAYLAFSKVEPFEEEEASGKRDEGEGGA